MNVCITAFTSRQNWNLMLQSYALQDSVHKAGHEPKIIFFGKREDEKFFSPPAPRRSVFDLLKDREEERRNQIAENFKRKYLRFTPNYPTYYDLIKINNSADCFITGGDRVWNCANGVSDIYFLKFVKDKPKIAYGPSFGSFEIPQRYIELLKERIESIEYLSVGDENTQRLVKEITGRDAPVVADPVFLKPKEEWDELIGKKTVKGKYIFVYPVRVTPAFEEFVLRVKKATGLRAVSLVQVKGCKIIKNIGPEDILAYIRDARYVVSNLYHAIAFSIIFEKQFFVPMGTVKSVPIAELLYRLGLEDRIIRETNKLDIKNPVNYAKASGKIQEYINESKSFLLGALNGAQEVLQSARN